MPMVDVSPEQAAMFFHTVEVNLNQTTTVVGWVPNAAKVHAIDSKPKTKPKAKATSSPERVKSSSTPSTPLRTEGPAPPREANTTPTPKENPGKGKGKYDPDQAGKIAANKKGQQCIRFYRGNCTRGESCQYGPYSRYRWKTLEDRTGVIGSLRPIQCGQARKRKRVRVRHRCSF